MMSLYCGVIIPPLRDIQLLQDDSLGVRGGTKRGRLEDGAEAALAVRLVGPAGQTTVGLELTGGLQSTGLALAYRC